MKATTDNCEKREVAHTKIAKDRKANRMPQSYKGSQTKFMKSLISVKLILIRVQNSFLKTFMLSDIR